MLRRSFLAGSTAGLLTLATETLGQDTIVLRLHTLVSLQSSMMAQVFVPWAARIDALPGASRSYEASSTSPRPGSATRAGGAAAPTDVPIIASAV